MLQALLLAEAEPGTREFLERYLVSDGFAVLGADAGREALELVERERPDLVPSGDLLTLEKQRQGRRSRDSNETGGPGGEPNAVALQRDPAHAQATPLSRRLVALSAMARSVCAASW
jgi:hypothetical protein